MKKAKPHINNLSTSRKVKVGDMVCYDLDEYDGFEFPEEPQTEHGLVVELNRSIVKIRPLQDWNQIRLVNAADCRVIKVK